MNPQWWLWNTGGLKEMIHVTKYECRCTFGPLHFSPKFMITCLNCIFSPLLTWKFQVVWLDTFGPGLQSYTGPKRHIATNWRWTIGMHMICSISVQNLYTLLDQQLHPRIVYYNKLLIRGHSLDKEVSPVQDWPLAAPWIWINWIMIKKHSFF